MGKFQVSVYIETTVRGPRRGAAAGMWKAVYRKKDGGTEYRKGILYREETTQNALTLALLNGALGALGKPCLIRVNTECPHVLNVMRNGLLPVWEKNGWINAKGQPVKNREEWKETCRLMRERDHAVTMEDEWHGFREEMRKTVREEMERRRGNVYQPDSV